jgi:CheY-like chemotaxis protein
MDTEIINLKKILLVEDDPRDVELTLTALEERQLASKVTVVRDGAEALDYLYRRGKFKGRVDADPTLILMDNKMPKVTGLEVLKILKTDVHLKKIPIVALTSSRETPDLREFYEHGVNAYVVKPVDFSEFIQAVKQLGAFWGTVNEPPPNTERERASIQNDEVMSPGKKEGKNENSASHPTSGG